jgi:hypothetical protein
MIETAPWRPCGPVNAGRKLKEVDLGRTRVSNAGLAHLSGLAGLRTLALSGTRVRDDGQALPEVKIIR